MDKMELFKKNMEEANFSKDFIIQSLQYFNELEKEREVQEMTSIEEVIGYYSKIGSYTCSTLKSEENLRYLRDDIALLKEEYPEILELDLYFKNIEQFEISILYILLSEFYPREEEEEEDIN